jgi:shikimate kinase
MSIAIGGFMGVGKSTAGRILAERMDLPFVDVDEQIELLEGRSVSAIFDRDGEEHFRTLETDALKTALGESPVVLALGGGALHRAENLDALKEKATILVLWMPLKSLQARVDATIGSRPLWRNADELFLAREAGYRSAGTLVDVDGLNRSEVADTLQRVLACD